MKRKLTSIGVLAALVSVLLPLGAASAQKKATSFRETTFPVSFVSTTAAGAVNLFGTLSIQKFDVQNDQVGL